MEEYYSNYHPGVNKLRVCFKKILDEENDLSETIQLVGRSSLSDLQKLTVEVARIIREDFLQQNAYSSYDSFCPIYKTIGMMKAIVCYYECGKLAIQKPLGRKITWNIIY